MGTLDILVVNNRKEPFSVESSLLRPISVRSLAARLEDNESVLLEAYRAIAAPARGLQLRQR